MSISICNNGCSLLVDTQADISVIRYSSLRNGSFIDGTQTIRIKGVTEQIIQSIGIIDATIHIDEISIAHVFHVVPDEFGIPSDGILGKDFLKIHRCVLDYEDMTLSFSVLDTRVSIGIHGGPSEDLVTIPARSEVYRTFHLNKYDAPQFIPNSEISPGVFTTNSIATCDSPIIRVCNTTNGMISIPKTIKSSHDLSNYSVYTMENTNMNPSRLDSLSKFFKTNSPAHSHNKLLPLLERYNDIFALPTDRMTQNNFYKQKLRLKDDVPVYSKNYRLPKSQKIEIDAQVQKLRENDLIEPSTSSYNSPLILVPKKSVDGSKKWRMCVDYRELNRKLIPDKFPLPRIDEILDGLGRAKYFSCLDLFSGFHQIQLEDGSREYTAFSTDAGTFQWKVLPFGLNVAPNSFCRMMSLAFAGLSPEQAFLYMDDLIVIGTSEANHLGNLEKVFKICRNFNLKLNPAKCEFFRSEVTFLGHRCTRNGLLPDSSKMEVIQKYPRPSDKEAVKRFTAFANYYRRFIQNFAELTAPLNKLTRKRVEFEWNEECEEAFRKIKNALTSPPILQYPDFNQPFIVTVDASNLACGAVLSQQHGDTDLPICFISRAFQKGELNKPIIEKELLAIHFAITYLRPYLFGTHFQVRSDHRPLIFLYNMKNPASKLTRIRLDLEEYDFEVVYIKGSTNVAADALSRITIEDLKLSYENTVTALPMMTRSRARAALSEANSLIESKPKQVTDTSKTMVTLDRHIFLKKLPQVRVSEMKMKILIKNKLLFEVDLNDYVVNERLPLESVLSRLEKLASDRNISHIKWSMTDSFFTMVNMNEFKNACNTNLKRLRITLFTPPRTVTNLDERSDIIKRYHDDPIFGGHTGRNRLTARLKESFQWKGMSKDIAKYISQCNKCILNKVKSSTREPMMLTPTPQAPFDVVIVDTIGPLQRSNNGNQYAVTLICDLTKYLITIPIPDKKAKSVAQAIFEQFILKHGPMKQIRTDMGTEYRNELLSELCKLLKIEQTFSTAYHHQTVGTIERNHRVFNEYIRSFVTDISEWDQYLMYFTFLYNTSQNSCFEEKYTPYELVFGKSVNTLEFIGKEIDPPYNLENYVKELKYRLQASHERAKVLLEKTKLRNKSFYDKQTRPIDVSVGDKILLRKEPYDKHSSIYSGPFTVVEVTHCNVRIEAVDKKQQIVHKNRIIRHQ